MKFTELLKDLTSEAKNFLEKIQRDPTDMESRRQLQVIENIIHMIKMGLWVKKCIIPNIVTKRGGHNVCLIGENEINQIPMIEDTRSEIHGQDMSEIPYV